VIERAVILSHTPPLRLDLALPQAAAAPAQRAGAIMTEAELRALERENLVATLERVGWRVAGSGGAAELLGIRPSTLRDRMKALGIQRRT
jgi:transcriptional regulator with GAF, ATPase, and Fis domain